TQVLLSRGRVNLRPGFRTRRRFRRLEVGTREQSSEITEIVKNYEFASDRSAVGLVSHITTAPMLACGAVNALAYVEHMSTKGEPLVCECRGRVSKNGRNQGLRIPRDLEWPGREAILRREGRRLVIEPVARPSLLAVLAKLTPLEEEFPRIERVPAEPVDL